MVNDRIKEPHKRVYSQGLLPLSSKSITAGNRKEAAGTTKLSRRGMVMNGAREESKRGDLGIWRGRKGYRAGGRGHVRFPPCYPQSLSQSRNFYNIIFHSALH